MSDYRKSPSTKAQLYLAENSLNEIVYIEDKEGIFKKSYIYKVDRKNDEIRALTVGGLSEKILVKRYDAKCCNIYPLIKRDELIAYKYAEMNNRRNKLASEYNYLDGLEDTESDAYMNAKGELLMLLNEMTLLVGTESENKDNYTSFVSEIELVGRLKRKLNVARYGKLNGAKRENKSIENEVQELESAHIDFCLEMADDRLVKRLGLSE